MKKNKITIEFIRRDEIKKMALNNYTEVLQKYFTEGWVIKDCGGDYNRSWIEMVKGDAKVRCSYRFPNVSVCGTENVDYELPYESCDRIKYGYYISKESAKEIAILRNERIRRKRKAAGNFNIPINEKTEKLIRSILSKLRVNYIHGFSKASYENLVSATLNYGCKRMRLGFRINHIHDGERRDIKYIDVMLGYWYRGKRSLPNASRYGYGSSFEVVKDY